MKAAVRYRTWWGRMRVAVVPGSGPTIAIDVSHMKPIFQRTALRIAKRLAR